MVFPVQDNRYSPVAPVEYEVRRNLLHASITGRIWYRGISIKSAGVPNLADAVESHEGHLPYRGAIISEEDR